MKVSIDSALSFLGERFQNIDFNGIQEIIDTFHDPKIAAVAYADPNNFMINEMQKKCIAVPDGLHFHRRDGDILIPPEPSDCVPPQVRMVLTAAPDRDFELEHFQLSGGGTGSSELRPNSCHSCFICISF